MRKGTRLRFTDDYCNGIVIEPEDVFEYEIKQNLMFIQLEKSQFAINLIYVKCFWDITE